MAYQLHSCAKAIYFLQSGHTSGMHMRIFKKDRLGSLTSKKNNTATFESYFYQDQSKKKNRFKIMSNISFKYTLNLQVPVMVLLQVLSGTSLAKNSQCMICAEDQPLLRRPLY